MSDQIRASHILISHADADSGSSRLSPEDALKQIQTLKDRIAKGEDFAEIAADNSDCPSAGRGGDLGFFPKGAMVPEFEAAAFELPVGGVSDVVETAFGYHLIQRTA
jgi:parvulin-like peptidyl-prolyl isomerase